MTAVPALPVTPDDPWTRTTRLAAVPPAQDPLPEDPLPQDSPPVALLVLTQDGRLSTPRPDQLAALVARMAPPAADPTVLVLGRLSLREDSYLAQVDDEPVTLTAREFDVLAALARNAGRVVTRQHLMRRIWRTDDAGSRSVDVHVARLRSKLGAAARQLVTVRGVGYRLDAA